MSTMSCHVVSMSTKHFTHGVTQSNTLQAVSQSSHCLQHHSRIVPHHIQGERCLVSPLDGKKYNLFWLPKSVIIMCIWNKMSKLWYQFNNWWQVNDEKVMEKHQEVREGPGWSNGYITCNTTSSSFYHGNIIQSRKENSTEVDFLCHS